MGKSKKQSKNERIEQFLKERYIFRYNTIKNRAEYSSKEGKSFQVLSKFELNSIRREIDRALGLYTSAENMRAILESDFSVRINPIQSYFKNLPKVEPLENGAIAKLANTVTVQNPKHWNEYLTKWLVGVVANALSDVGCQNHICLVLTGEQGKFKTTWLDSLCPQSLKSYLFTGKIDPQNKDVLTLIAECLFINIDDQLKALNKRDENELKNLITTPSVKYRKPYDAQIEDYPHLASFMASVNGNDFLTDPTGSRRFLPFEVLAIDIKETEKISMDDVFSEVMYLLDSGFRYWFIDEEITELHKQSAGFHVQTMEYEMLLQGFEQPFQNPFDENTSDSFMTTSNIISYLKGYTTLNLSEKRMGEALRKAGYKRKIKRVNDTPLYGWVIEKVSPTTFNSYNF